MADTEEPKKPSQTKKSMDAPSAPSSSQSPKMSDGLGKIVSKLEEIKLADEEQRAEIREGLADLSGSMSGVKDAVDDNAETPEEKKEKKGSLSKALEKLGETFKKSFGGLDGLKGLLKGSLGPLKSFWDAVKKVKGFILAFLGVFLLKNLSIKDIKEMWEGMKEFFKETKILFGTIMEFMRPIIDWFKADFVPTTFTLFKDTLTDLQKVFEDLTRDFHGFTEKGWKGKLLTIITALGSLGDFVTSFFANVVDWAFRLMGYDGSITKDLRTWLEGTFGTDFMDSAMTIFNTMAGAMVVARVFGMPASKFISMTAGMLWKSVSRIFAVIFTSLNPIALAIAITGLTIYYNKEITAGLTSAMDMVSNWFGNLGVLANNALVGTALGKLFGLEKKEFTSVEEDNAARNKKYRENLAEAEAEVKRLEEWKKMSGPGGNQAAVLQSGKKLFDDTTGWFSQSKDMTDLQNARYKLKVAKEFVNSIPDEPDATITMTKSPPSMPEEAPSMTNNALSKSLSTLDGMRESPISTEIFEGFGKVGKPGFAYDDSKGNRTIGYGFNMDKDNAEKIMKAAGINKNWQDLYAGKIALTEAEGKKLKAYEMEYFRNSAKAWIGVDKWSKMNVGAQNALTDMAFNMGGSFTNKGEWPDLREALRSGNMGAVGPAIRDSNYINDVQKARSGQNISALSNAYAKPSMFSTADLSPSKALMEKQNQMMADNSMNIKNEGDNITTGNMSALDQGRRNGGPMSGMAGFGLGDGQYFSSGLG